MPPTIGSPIALPFGILVALSQYGRQTSSHAAIRLVRLCIMGAGTQQSWIRYQASSREIEWADAFFAGCAFSPHRHDTYAVGYTMHGVQKFDYRGAARQSCPGDVFVLHPDEVHDGRPGTEEGYGYRICYIAPHLIAAAADATELPFVDDAVSADPRLRTAIVEAFPDPGQDLDALQGAEAITVLSDALYAAAGRPRSAKSTVDTKTMRAIREQLEESAGEGGTSLSALEREHGLDRYNHRTRFPARVRGRTASLPCPAPPGPCQAADHGRGVPGRGGRRRRLLGPEPHDPPLQGRDRPPSRCLARASYLIWPFPFIQSRTQPYRSARSRIHPRRPIRSKSGMCPAPSSSWS